ncbi:MAG: hypothetical protein A2017_12615 [Lentisphaerae bacterium GWF2_44_16]|nr:MAG: hypothetical protein A2017_12615 [Lentisphaerae bacterium GWF2_44_16]
MKSYKFYLHYDLSVLGTEWIFAVFIIAFLLQVFMNPIIFGVLFMVSCALLPSLLSYIFASWKFQDSRLTEYFFSLPISRIQIIFSGFLLTFTSVLILFPLCSIIEISGFPHTVQEYLMNILGGDFYAVPEKAETNITFRMCNITIYLMIAWTSSCFGWLPFLITGAGLKRIITSVFSYALSLGLCAFALPMLYYDKFEILFFSLLGSAVIISPVFIMYIRKFKKAQLFY